MKENSLIEYEVKDAQLIKQREKEAKSVVNRDSNSISFSLIAMNIISELVMLFIILAIVVLIFLSNVVSGLSLDFSSIWDVYNNIVKEDLIIYIINGISLISSILIMVFFIAKSMNVTIGETLPKKRTVTRRQLLATIPAGFVVFMVANMIVNYLVRIFPQTYSSNPLSSFFDSLSIPLAQNHINNIIYIFCIAIVPAFAEEYIFRGVILGSLKRKYGESYAIIISALFFGLYHGNFVQIPFAFISGLALGFITVYTNSMIPAIIVHFLNNFYSAFHDISADYFVKPFDSVIPNSFGFFVVIIGILCFMYLSKKDKNMFRFKKTSPLPNLSYKKTILATVLTPGFICFSAMMVSLSIVKVISGE